MPSRLAEGREAIKHHDWETALEALTDSEKQGDLPPDDLLLLGDAYWWTGRPDSAIEAFEKAFGQFVRDDRNDEAAVTGALLAYFAIRRRSASIANGWVARVEHLLEGQPTSSAHAWLSLLRVASSMFIDVDLAEVMTRADETIELGKQLRLPGVQSLAMSFKGIAMIQTGRWKEGVSLVDEATVVAMSEGGDLRAASDVYCNTIAACANLGDFRRAGEWTEEAERWMHSNSVGGYTGICKVHRAELKRVRGSYAEAEQAARNACVELERFRLIDGMGFAYYEIGEVRRRMGDLDAAEKAFQTAYEYGHRSQPGYSLLLMDRGDVAAAAESISGALRRRSGGGLTSRLSRAKLLPAQVEISLAAGDLETAHNALDELKSAAEDYDSTLWRAYALACEGSIDLEEGDSDAAIEALERSWALWRDSDMPWEGAQARVTLGRARQAAGDTAGARLEFNAARSAFLKLGARHELERLAELTGEQPIGAERKGEIVTKAFMFTDIVASTDLIGIIGDEAWESLLGWHDRTLRETFAAHGGEEVRHTGDGFFVAFDDAALAIECAVDIQRRLAKHRADHGFSPWVRIGIHSAEARRDGSDYSGGGVHVAARVGALGHREEIFVSADTLEAAGAISFGHSEPNDVTLKGVAEPVSVSTIDWQ